MLLPSGNSFKCHEEVLYFQLLIPPKRFDIFSPRLGDAQKVYVHSDFSLNIGGCSEGLGAFRFFFKQQQKGMSTDDL